MKDLFNKFSKTGVLVIGDLMVDQYIWGKVRRISPEAPVPVVEVTDENLLLGGAANVAQNLLALGGRVFVCGSVGRDNMGKVLLNMLAEKGINSDGIFIDGDRPTTVKTRVLAHSQQVVRFDRETKSDISSSLQASIIDYVRSCLPNLKGIIISDYCKGLITKKLIKKIIDIAGPKIVVAADPKIGHFPYYKGVDLVTPNLGEASFGSGIDIKDDITLKQAGRLLIRKLGCKAVVITRGDAGMSLFEKSGKTFHIPTCAQEVYDVSGAGDTVIAALTLCHSAGANLSDSAVIANHAAGVVVAKIGTAVATQHDITISIKKCKPRQLKNSGRIAK